MDSQFGPAVIVTVSSSVSATRSRHLWGVLAILLVVVGGSPESYAQSTTASPPFCEEPDRRAQSLDTRGLGEVYCDSPPFFAVSLDAVHHSARPVFYGAVPVAGGAVLLRGTSDYSSVYRLALAQGVTYGLVLGIKRAAGRSRPYVTRSLSPRAERYQRPAYEESTTSFPSGHAAVSTALALSWSLTHPKWYVVGPGAAWALGVSTSRLYLGVHYPSDVLVGALIGSGVAVLVHELRAALTPTVRRDGFQLGAPVALRIRF